MAHHRSIAILLFALAVAVGAPECFCAPPQNANPRPEFRQLLEKMTSFSPDPCGPPYGANQDSNNIEFSAFDRSADRVTEELNAARLPPNTKPWSLGMQNGFIYTAISQGCGGRPFSFFTYDTKTRKTSAFLPMGGGLWGRRGVSIDSNGGGYMGTGDGPYYPENKNLGNAIVAVKRDANSQLHSLDGSRRRT